MPFPGFPGFGQEDSEATKAKGPGFDFMRFIRGVWKRLWLVALVAITFSATSVGLAYKTIQHKWEGVVVLIMRTQQDQFSLSASQPFKPQQYNLKTLLDTLKLPSSLKGVIDRVGIDALPRTLASAIEVVLGKDSNIFAIKVTWKDPRLAATLANEVAAAFVERSREIRRQDAEESFSNYSGQLTDAQEKLRVLNAELLVFKEANKISDLEKEIEVILGDISRLDAEYQTKLAEVQAMQANRERLEQLIAAEPEMVVSSTIYRSPLKQRLADYEWQLQEARSRYTNENPKVTKLEKRVSVLQQMIDESNDEAVPENQYSPNSQREDYEVRLQELIDGIKVAEAQVAALKGTTQGMNDKLALLAAKQKEYRLLQARISSAEELEKTLASRVDEAHVIMQRNESNFDIIEAANPPAEPLSSPRKLVAIGGTVLGLGAGVFLALLLELMDPWVRTRHDAMNLTGAQLVCEFQQVPEGERKVIDPMRPAEGVAIIFRRFINDMDSQLEEEDWLSLAIISLEPEAGRSLVALNLAQSLALKERPVMLVDADLRSVAGTRPTDLLGLEPRAHGLYQSLKEGFPPSKRETATPGLHLIETGIRLPPDDGGLLVLGSRHFESLATTLARPGHQVLFDLPPLSAQETVLEAVAAIGNALLVLRSGHSRRGDIGEMIDTLEGRGVNLRGVVITEVPAGLMSIKPIFEPKPKVKKKFFHWRPKPAQQEHPGASRHAA